MTVEPLPIVSNRSGRRIRMPARFQDYLPGSATHLAHMPLSAHQKRALQPPQPANDPSPSPSDSGDKTPPHHSDSPFEDPPSFTTEPDSFGLFRIYPTKPTHIPQDSLESVSDAPTFLQDPPVDKDARKSFLGVPGNTRFSTSDIFAPFSNPTSAIFLAWHFSGSGLKSNLESDRFARLQQDPRYRTEELKNFSIVRETKQLDDFLDSKANPFRSDYGWRKSSVDIKLPKENVSVASDADIPRMKIDGVWHRNILDIITTVFQSEAGLSFNLTPFGQRWKAREGKVVEVISEGYSSPEMLRAHEEINALPREPGDDMERIVASLMIWSDSTHMTDFGDTSMWPFYLSFGNQSKYSRGKPTAAGCHHLGYIPKVCVFLYLLVFYSHSRFPSNSAPRQLSGCVSQDLRDRGKAGRPYSLQAGIVPGDMGLTSRREVHGRLSQRDSYQMR